MRETDSTSPYDMANSKLLAKTEMRPLQREQ